MSRQRKARCSRLFARNKEDTTLFTCRVCTAMGNNWTRHQSESATSNLCRHFKQTQKDKVSGKMKLKFETCAKTYDALQQVIKQKEQDSKFDVQEWLKAKLLAIKVAHPRAMTAKQTTLNQFTSKEWPQRTIQIILETWRIRHGIAEKALDDFLFTMLLKKTAAFANISEIDKSVIQSRRTRSRVIVDVLHTSLAARANSLKSSPDR